MAYRTVLQILISVSIVSLINGQTGCEDRVLFDAMSQFSVCVKQVRYVVMNKPIEDDMGEPCRKDWNRLESCWKTQVLETIKKCKTAEQEQMLHKSLLDINSGRLQFMCEGNGKFIKQFWKKNGAECYENTKKLIDGAACDQFMPDVLKSDYKNPETCKGMMSYLMCLQSQFDMACDDFAKKIVYTYFKRGLLMTPCHDYIKQNDNSGLEIIYVPSSSVPVNSDNSVGAVSASFAFVVFGLCKILLFH